ncbi:hypothetical protein T459_21637 [Capsicum annuum]|uniref:Mon2/Sec7/BIG1-like HUS domain-containing protein n=1 Tax=Capsicum annuum TaxID=4072 RepID=A0A2G2YX68_CAPAN|nr:hypothetical protein T459_21637 [Capsicum annuum]
MATLFSSSDAVFKGAFEENFSKSCPGTQFKTSQDGQIWCLTLDQVLDCGFMTKQSYRFGWFSTKLKLVGGDSVVVVTTFYITEAALDAVQKLPLMLCRSSLLMVILGVKRAHLGSRCEASIEIDWVVRTCYDICLESKNVVNPTTAKASLGFITKVLQDIDRVFNAGTLRGKKGELVDGEGERDDDLEVQIRNNLRRDALLVFRALCKFSMKTPPKEAAADPQLMRRKIVALELLKILLENAGAIFRTSDRHLPTILI